MVAIGQMRLAARRAALAGRPALSSARGTAEVSARGMCSKRGSNRNAREAGSKNAEKKGRGKQAVFSSTATDVLGLDASQSELIYDFKTAELDALVPEGFGGDIEEDLDLTDNISLMVREPYLHALEKMTDLESNPEKRTSDMKGMLFAGERGIGKSMALNSVLARARASDWLTMYAPDAREWVTPKGAGTRGTGTGVPIVPSQLREGFFGQPNGSKAMLQHLKNIHGQKLKDLPKRLEYNHNAYDGDSTLMSIVERGLKSAVFASDALYDLRLEFGKVTEFPVLIAIDQVNSLYWPSCFYNKGKAVSPENVLFAKTFRCFGEEGEVLPEQRLERGLIVSATTAKYGFAVAPGVIQEHYEDTKVKFFAPFDVRGAKVNANAKQNMDLVPVEPFNDNELRNYVIHLKRHKVLDTTEVLEGNTFQTFKTHSGAVPRSVRNTLLLPYPF
mmetsp:Transcript_7474/g.13004  ORF Transcript_7474/g.13004 Transcript_7474/m.13004 type:complete len:446 (+) Transcript_7474:172-1509(+)